MYIEIIKELIGNINYNEEKLKFTWLEDTLIVEVWTVLSKKEIYCTQCGCYGAIVVSTKIKKVSHTTIKIPKITLRIRQRQYRCDECGAYFLEPLQGFKAKQKVSNMIIVRILDDLKNLLLTYTSVAEKYNVSPTFVQEVFDNNINVSVSKLPAILCIDEVYAKKLTKKKYCCILFSFRDKKIVDILNSRQKIDLESYLSQIPLNEREQVTHICMDMHKTYRIVAHKFLPRAKVLIDSFHVIQQLNKDFNKIRVRIMKRFEKVKDKNVSEYWYLKTFWKLLLGDIKDYNKSIYIKRYKMEISIRQVIEYMLKVDKELELAYNIKEEYRNFNTVVTSSEIAYSVIGDFIKNIKDSKISEYESFRTCLINWRGEIANSFDRINNRKIRISNGPLERLNKDIKLHIEISYGLKNFERFKKRVMYSKNQDSNLSFSKSKK